MWDKKVFCDMILVIWCQKQNNEIRKNQVWEKVVWGWCVCVIGVGCLCESEYMSVACFIIKYKYDMM